MRLSLEIALGVAGGMLVHHGVLVVIHRTAALMKRTGKSLREVVRDRKGRTA